MPSATSATEPSSSSSTRRAVRDLRGVIVRLGVEREMAVEGCAADAECAGDLGHRVLLRSHRLSGSKLLGGHEARAAAEPPAGSSGGQAGAGALPDDLPLEFGQSAEDVELEASGRGGGVDLLGQ